LIDLSRKGAIELSKKEKGCLRKSWVNLESKEVAINSSVLVFGITFGNLKKKERHRPRNWSTASKENPKVSKRSDLQRKRWFGGGGLGGKSNKVVPLRPEPQR